MLTLDDHIAARVQRADYAHWRHKVESVGGCAKPIRLSGTHRLEHKTNGAPIYHAEGDAFVACGNRRESVCPTCSNRYAADAFHLIRAGLAGGSKGVPESVTAKPRAFVTASVLWQAHAGQLWSRFIQRLRRELAKAAGIPVRQFGDHLRVSYGKVAEYQRRGLVHFHAIIRLDGPEGPADPTPAWADLDLLDDAVRAAAATVRVTTHRPDGEVLDLTWGAQVDIRRVNPATVNKVEDPDGAISEAALAGYVAKYATKGTGKSEAADRPIRSQEDIDHLHVSDHHRRIIQTAWDLGGLFAYEHLNLRRWAHMLAFRGHFLTKSRQYSVTFGDLRNARRTWRLETNLAAADLDPTNVLVINDWHFDGVGYADEAERELAAAIATRIREHRATKHRKENEHAQAA